MAPSRINPALLDELLKGQDPKTVLSSNGLIGEPGHLQGIVAAMELLRLDPKDIWGDLLLGNLLYQHYSPKLNGDRSKCQTEVT